MIKIAISRKFREYSGLQVFKRMGRELGIGGFLVMRLEFGFLRGKKDVWDGKWKNGIKHGKFNFTRNGVTKKKKCKNNKCK